MIMNNHPLLEGPAIKMFESWFGERPIICPAPFDFEVVRQESQQTPDTLKVVDFLDSMSEKYGKNSVVYVSYDAISGKRLINKNPGASSR